MSFLAFRVASLTRHYIKALCNAPHPSLQTYTSLHKESKKTILQITYLLKTTFKLDFWTLKKIFYLKKIFILFNPLKLSFAIYSKLL